MINKLINVALQFMKKVLTIRTERQVKINFNPKLVTIQIFLLYKEIGASCFLGDRLAAIFPRGHTLPTLLLRDRPRKTVFFRGTLASSFIAGTDFAKKIFGGQPCSHFSPGTYFAHSFITGQTSENGFFQGHTCLIFYCGDRLCQKNFPGTYLQPYLLGDRLRDIAFFQGQTLDTVFFGGHIYNIPFFGEIHRIQGFLRDILTKKDFSRVTSKVEFFRVVFFLKNFY